ncbi:EamA family transporter [Nitriliruptoraceae bacterium ZYF776]|nr:EamA family transporter [Profundirhabdus halotolerans]
MTARSTVLRGRRRPPVVAPRPLGAPTTGAAVPWTQRLLAPSARAKLLVALLTVYVVWGSTYLAIGVAVDTIPPFLMLTVRFAVAGAILAVVTRRQGGPRIRWRHVRNAAATGVLLLVGGTGLVTAAQTRIPSGTAALLCATVPLWLALLARARFGERLKLRAWIGLGVGLLGVAALVDPRGGGDLWPLLLVLVGAVSWAVGSLHSRSSDPDLPPLRAAALEMLGAAAGFGVVALALGEPARFELAAVDGASWLALLYLVTAGSLVAFTAYRYLLAHGSTTLVGSYAYVNPVVAVGLGWAFAGELITGRTLLGGGIVLLAVVLIVTGRPDEPVPAQPTSGGDVFAGSRRWHLQAKRLGRLPARARLYVAPGATTARPARRDGAPLDQPSTPPATLDG